MLCGGEEQGRASKEGRYSMPQAPQTLTAPPAYLRRPVSVMVIWLTLPDPVSLALTLRVPAEEAEGQAASRDSGRQ
jgi:hypothetical protein